MRIKKGDKWLYPEDLPASDILPKIESPGGGGSGGHKKKKGKKGKKKPRR